MPQCKALKTFNSTQYGYIRAGSRFSSEKNYANQLRRNGLIEILKEDIEPSRTQAFNGPPVTQGKEPPFQPPSLASNDTAVLAADGAEKPSALSRVARALQRPTAPSSKASAKR